MARETSRSGESRIPQKAFARFIRIYNIESLLRELEISVSHDISVRSFFGESALSISKIHTSYEPIPMDTGYGGERQVSKETFILTCRCNSNKTVNIKTNISNFELKNVSLTHFNEEIAFFIKAVLCPINSTLDPEGSREQYKRLNQIIEKYKRIYEDQEIEAEIRAAQNPDLFNSRIGGMLRDLNPEITQSLLDKSTNEHSNPTLKAALERRDQVQQQRDIKDTKEKEFAEKFTEILYLKNLAILGENLANQLSHDADFDPVFAELEREVMGIQNIMKWHDGMWLRVPSKDRHSLAYEIPLISGDYPVQEFKKEVWVKWEEYKDMKQETQWSKPLSLDLIITPRSSKTYYNSVDKDPYKFVDHHYLQLFIGVTPENQMVVKIEESRQLKVPTMVGFKLPETEMLRSYQQGFEWEDFESVKEYLRRVLVSRYNDLIMARK